MADSLAAIGSDAVMVEDESAITGAGEGSDELERPGEMASVIGNRVLSAEGNELGEVAGVIIATGPSPRAVGYEIDSKDRSDPVFVPISAQIALSDDNLMLPEEATEFIRNDLAGFGAAVASYGNSAMQGEDS